MVIILNDDQNRYEVSNDDNKRILIYFKDLRFFGRFGALNCCSSQQWQWTLKSSVKKRKNVSQKVK